MLNTVPNSSPKGFIPSASTLLLAKYLKWLLNNKYNSIYLPIYRLIFTWLIFLSLISHFFKKKGKLLTKYSALVVCWTLPYLFDSSWASQYTRWGCWDSFIMASKGEGLIQKQKAAFFTWPLKHVNRELNTFWKEQQQQILKKGPGIHSGAGGRGGRGTKNELGRQSFDLLRYIHKQCTLRLSFSKLGFYGTQCHSTMWNT